MGTPHWKLSLSSLWERSRVTNAGTQGLPLDNQHARAHACSEVRFVKLELLPYHGSVS